jgi:hypothetical protein
MLLLSNFCLREKVRLYLSFPTSLWCLFVYIGRSGEIHRGGEFGVRIGASRWSSGLVGFGSLRSIVARTGPTVRRNDSKISARYGHGVPNCARARKALVTGVCQYSCTFETFSRSPWNLCFVYTTCSQSRLFPLPIQSGVPGSGQENGAAIMKGPMAVKVVSQLYVLRKCAELCFHAFWSFSFCWTTV